MSVKKKIVFWVLFVVLDFCFSLYTLLHHLPAIESEKVAFVAGSCILALIAGASMKYEVKEVYLVSVLVLIGNCLQYGFDNSTHYAQAILLGYVSFLASYQAAKHRVWRKGGVVALLMVIGVVSSGIIMVFGKATQFMGVQICLPVLGLYPIISNYFVMSKGEVHLNKSLNSIEFKYLVLSAYTAALSMICIRECEYASLLILLVLYLNTILFHVRDYLFKIFLFFAGTGFSIYSILTRRHIRDRFSGWIHLKDQINDSGNKVVASVRYLYQNIRRSGFYGLGLGNCSNTRVVPTLDNDHIAQAVLQEWGLILAVILAGIYIVLFLLMIRNVQKSREIDLIQNCALVMFCSFALSVCGTIGVFIIAGIALPWVGDGVNLILLQMMNLGTCLGVKMQPAMVHKRV